MDSGLPSEDVFVMPELGASFSPFDLTVRTGEDVLGRIFSVALRGSDQGVYALVATGSVSGFTLKQPDGDDVSYQGTFKILRLQGLYLPMEQGGAVSGRIKILVGVCDGSQRVVEGVVSGGLIASSTVQVAVGNFKVDFDKLPSASESVFEAVPTLEQKRPRFAYYRTVSGVLETHYTSDWEQMCTKNSRQASRSWLLPQLQPPYRIPNARFQGFTFGGDMNHLRVYGQDLAPETLFRYPTASGDMNHINHGRGQVFPPQPQYSSTPTTAADLNQNNYFKKGLALPPPRRRLDGSDEDEDEDDRPRARFIMEMPFASAPPPPQLHSPLPRFHSSF